jgi:hypothetical protein
MNQNKPIESSTNNEHHHYYYFTPDGRKVFTEQFHLERGYCCGCGCRHCPYEPKHIRGNRAHDITKV